MNIGENIKRLLIQKNITQKEFANILKIPYTTLNGYLRDVYEPDFEMIKKIAVSLGVSTDSLLDMETPHTIRLDEQEFDLVKQFRLLTAQQQELVLEQVGFMNRQNARGNQKSSMSNSDKGNKAI